MSDSLFNDKPLKMKPDEMAYYLARTTTDYFIVDYFLHLLCDKVKHAHPSDKIFWMLVREEWDRIKMYE